MNTKPTQKFTESEVLSSLDRTVKLLDSPALLKEELGAFTSKEFMIRMGWKTTKARQVLARLVDEGKLKSQSIPLNGTLTKIYYH